MEIYSSARSIFRKNIQILGLAVRTAGLRGTSATSVRLKTAAVSRAPQLAPHEGIDVVQELSVLVRVYIICHQAKAESCVL